MKKETLYKTCKFDGEFVAIENWYQDGESYMYKIRRIDGTKELVHASECSDFVL